MDLGCIKADAGYIGQVLMNLVANARDAMPGGGRLSLSTSNVTLNESHAIADSGIFAGDYVALALSDSGAGMSEETKAHIFDAFYTTKIKGRGTGIGLSTCLTIVKLSSGHIVVNSTPGSGPLSRYVFRGSDWRQSQRFT